MPRQRKTEPKRTLLSRSPEETFRAGDALGKTLRAGDHVLLSGPLGAGKTLFTRGIARGMGVRDAEDVASPTFVLMTRFKGRRGRPDLVHMDLYRVDSHADWEAAGLAEALEDEGAVVVMEWGEKCPAKLSGARRIVFRVMKDGGRKIAYSRSPGGAGGRKRKENSGRLRAKAMFA